MPALLLFLRRGATMFSGFRRCTTVFGRFSGFAAVFRGFRGGAAMFVRKSDEGQADEQYSKQSHGTSLG